MSQQAHQLPAEMVFSINGDQYVIAQIPCGPMADMWCWSTHKDEGEAFDTHTQALQDAMRHEREEAGR